MLKINHQTDYALRIILYLAKLPAGTRVPRAQIQKEMLIPAALSPCVITELAHAAFITTHPGKNKNIELAKKPEDISMWEIVHLFEDIISENIDAEEEAPDDWPWLPLNAIIQRELEKISFQDLVIDAEMLDAISAVQKI